MKPKMKIESGRYMKAGDEYFFEGDIVRIIMQNNEVFYGTITVMDEDHFYLHEDNTDRLLVTTILMPYIHSIYKAKVVR
ncbi:hypothetical protein [Bacillus phage Nachito]|nr:hypothetical protein [Bacillus phage Nachito]